MRFSLVLIFLFAISCGGDSTTDPGNGNDPPPPPDPTLSSVTCTLDAIADMEYEAAVRPSVDFAWSGHGVMSDASTTVLDSAVVKVGGVRVQKFTGGTSGTGSLGSGDTEDGNNTLSVTCYRESRTGADTEGFGIFKLVTLNFSATHFFSQEPNLTGTTVTVKQGSDTRAVTLTDGTGSLIVRAGTNTIQIQDTDSGQLHYLEEVGAASGEHLVFDRQNLAQTIDVTGDTEYQIVSVDDEQFLTDMAQQWNTLGTVHAPMPGSLKIVLYEGNPTCNEFWHPEYDQYDDCGDAVTWFPGKVLQPDEIANFYTFIDDTREVLNNPIIPWRPYSIEPILADTAGIRDYVDSLRADIALAWVRTPNTHVIIGTGGAPGREVGYIANTNQGIHYMINSAATANGIMSAIYSNEMKLFGSFRESLNYPICSIRDDESNMHPDCPFGIWEHLPNYNPNIPTWFEMDKKMIAVVATYLARAQTQPNPFNVVLPEP